jgi:FAD/FMN-containing dehydrogenase
MASSSERALSIDRLRTEFDGQVIAPSDTEYDAARTVFLGAIDRRPAVIIRPSNPSEVARVVELAQNTGFELAIRSGGHSTVGHSVTDGGIVLDLAGMRAFDVDVDVDERTVWAQTGLTAGAYGRAAAQYGLATGFGDTATVGIGGITLGGGVGFLSRKYGLTIDQVLAAEVVTADGQILTVDVDHHPDLFWALRGGGGNFGVVTRFKYELQDLPSVVGGMLMLPATGDVIYEFLTGLAAAPPELSAILNIMPAPPMPFVPTEHHGKIIVMALMCFAGPTEAGEKAVAPFKALATPIVDMVRPMSYPEMFAPEDYDYHPKAVARNLFVDSVDRATVDLILDRLTTSTATMRVTQLRVLGGAITNVPDNATAYAHRGRQIMVNVAAFYESPEDRIARAAWVNDLVDALRDDEPGAYVNFLAEDGPTRIREAYPGETWERLGAIKDRYDPSNIFRLNHNIPPTPSS